MATVSDKRTLTSDGIDTTEVVRYFAEVMTAQDYYPFGSTMPGRTYDADTAGYRYGFNGKEADPENGNQYDYGFRIYNPQVGKFLSVDPLTGSFPWYTPYQFAGNKPISCADLDGAEEEERYWTVDNDGKCYLTYRRYSQESPGPGGVGYELDTYVNRDQQILQSHISAVNTITPTSAAANAGGFRGFMADLYRNTTGMESSDNSAFGGSLPTARGDGANGGTITVEGAYANVTVNYNAGPVSGSFGVGAAVVGDEAGVYGIQGGGGGAYRGVFATRMEKSLGFSLNVEFGFIDSWGPLTFDNYASGSSSGASVGAGRVAVTYAGNIDTNPDGSIKNFGKQYRTLGLNIGILSSSGFGGPTVGGGTSTTTPWFSIDFSDETDECTDECTENE